LRITDLKPGSGPSVRGCLDWTERRPHLAGRLGTAIMRAMLNNGWLTRRPSNRAFTITNLGAEQLVQLGIDPASPASPLPMGPSGLEDHSTFPASDPRSQASYSCTPE
jgi:hypothetical protein